MLKIDNITKNLNGKTLFEGLTFSVDCGEIVAITGCSGIGKTTLLNIIAGLISADSGSVSYKSIEIIDKTGFCSYMCQHQTLIESKTVIGNLLLASKRFGRNGDIRNTARNGLMQLGLDKYEKQYPTQLSGGMAKRVEFLRTLLFKHEILLLDEPFSSLDDVTKNEIIVMLKHHVSSRRVCCIMVTHDINEAQLIANRVIDIL